MLPAAFLHQVGSIEPYRRSKRGLFRRHRGFEHPGGVQGLSSDEERGPPQIVDYDAQLTGAKSGDGVILSRLKFGLVSF
jgi:hypothetical protein